MNTVLRSASVLALLAAALAASAQNLVNNPGFESGALAPYWTSTGGVFVTTAGPHSGGYDAAFGGTDTLSQSVATVPGAAYTLSFYLAESGAGASFTASFGGSPVLALTNQNSGGSFAYALYSVPVTATSASSAVSFASSIVVGGLFLDDVSLTPTPEPAPLAALGLGALGVLRRRKRG